jgi:hypothetical protein
MSAPIRLRHLLPTGPQLTVRLTRGDRHWWWQIESTARRRPLAVSANSYKRRQDAVRDLETVTGLRVSQHWKANLNVEAIQIQPTATRFYLIRRLHGGKRTRR